MTSELTEQPIFRELLRIYDDVEAAMNCRASCEACGRCCDFIANDYTLFASRPEIDLVSAAAGRRPQLIEGRCSFQDTEGRCTMHKWRPLGCRTHFCNTQNEEAFRLIYEQALNRIRRSCENLKLPWQYRPVFAE